MNIPISFISYDFAGTEASARPPSQLLDAAEVETDKTPGASSARLLQAAVLAMEQAPVSLVLADADGVVQYVNPLFCASYNCPAYQAPGQSLRAILAGHISPDRFSSMWAAVTAGKIWEDEFPLTPTAAHPRWVKVLFRPVLDASNRLESVVGIEEDITRRKDAELVLRDSEEKLRQILLNARDGIVIVDENCRVRVWNEASIRIFGFSGEDAHDRNLNDLLTPRRFRRLMRLRFEHVRTANLNRPFSDTLECWAVCKDRSEILMEVSISVITLNHRWHLLLIVRDITERKKAETERDMIMRSLEDALINVKTLRGLIPICSGCKKIRNDAGYWKEIATYISAHSEAQFSHGICPDCARAYFPDYAQPQGNKTSRPPLDKVA